MGWILRYRKPRERQKSQVSRSQPHVQIEPQSAEMLASESAPRSRLQVLFKLDGASHVGERKLGNQCPRTAF